MKTSWISDKFTPPPLPSYLFDLSTATPTVEPTPPERWHEPSNQWSPFDRPSRAVCSSHWQEDAGYIRQGDDARRALFQLAAGGSTNVLCGEALHELEMLVALPPPHPADTDAVAVWCTSHDGFSGRDHWYMRKEVMKTNRMLTEAIRAVKGVCVVLGEVSVGAFPRSLGVVPATAFLVDPDCKRYRRAAEQYLSEIDGFIRPAIRALATLEESQLCKKLLGGGRGLLAEPIPPISAAQAPHGCYRSRHLLPEAQALLSDRVASARASLEAGVATLEQICDYLAAAQMFR